MSLLLPRMTGEEQRWWLFLRRRLAVVTLGPFGRDALAVLGHPLHVVLDHRLLGVGRIVLRQRIDAGIGDDRVRLAVELVGLLAGGPVGKLLGRREILGALDDGGGIELPTHALLGHDEVERRTRSEERRVGKEDRSRGTDEASRKK